MQLIRCAVLAEYLQLLLSLLLNVTGLLILFTCIVIHYWPIYIVYLYCDLAVAKISWNDGDR